jgi:glycerol-3-phosphate dehydrogenase
MIQQTSQITRVFKYIQVILFDITKKNKGDVHTQNVATGSNKQCHARHQTRERAQELKKETSNSGIIYLAWTKLRNRTDTVKTRGAKKNGGENINKEGVALNFAIIFLAWTHFALLSGKKLKQQLYVLHDTSVVSSLNVYK